MGRLDWAPPKKKPWDNRIYAEPLRTYTGSVVYKRPKHFFTVKDAERIMNKIDWGTEVEDETNLKKVLLFIKDMTIKMLEKILYFLDSETVAELYDWVYVLLGQLFRVDVDYMMPNRSKMEDLIYALASKARLEITIKRL